jgi:hypothetical protein
MKKLKLIIVAFILLLSFTIQAQVSVNVNIGNAPSWGPSGYSEVEYYYLPDIETYYDIRTSEFIYFGGRTWIRSRYLPREYRYYNLNSGYKVVLSNYHGSRPYTHFQDNRRDYYRGYKKGSKQRTIGEYNRYNNRNENNGHENRVRGNGNRGHENRGHENRGHGRD